MFPADNKLVSSYPRSEEQHPTQSTSFAFIIECVFVFYFYFIISKMSLSQATNYVKIHYIKCLCPTSNNSPQFYSEGEKQNSNLERNIQFLTSSLWLLMYIMLSTFQTFLRFPLSWGIMPSLHSGNKNNLNKNNQLKKWKHHRAEDFNDRKHYFFKNVECHEYCF